MKKVIVFALTMLTALFVLASPVSAADQPSFSLKDGMKVRLLIEKTDEESFQAKVVLENNKNDFLGNTKVSLTVPEGWTFTADTTEAEIGIYEKGEFVFDVAKEENPAEMSFPVWIVAGIAAGLTMAGIILFLIIKGKKKSNIAMFLIFAISVSLLPFSTTQAKTKGQIRTITLSDKIVLGGEELRVKAEIEYEYNFEEKDVKETDGMEKFEITYFYGPPGYGNFDVDEDLIKDIADCGFTSVPLSSGRKNMKRILELMDKNGLTCNAIFDTKITDQLIVAENRDDFTQEEIDRRVKDLVDYFAECENITGWNIIDEPSANFFPVMQKIIDAFRRYSPDKELHINIWPNYANSDQLQAKNYTEFLKKYMEEIDSDYISFDYYHFTSDTTSSDLARLYDNIEQIRSAGLKYGKDYMQIVLLTKHGSYANITPYQLQWEVNLDLVYGAKRISYFTFWNDQYMEGDGWENACMTSTGEKTEHYYEVQKVNKWLLPLGKELFDKTSTAVFHLGDTSVESIGYYAKGYEPYGMLGECEGNDFVIGFFDDTSFMIMNKQYYEVNGGEKNRFTFIDIKNILEYFDTDTASWQNAEEKGIVTRNENGQYVAAFDPGQAYLFRQGQN